MREIEFRGKTEKTNKWEYGLIGITKYGNLIINNSKQHFIDENTLGQFTGEKDKNNKKIYEGDILLVIPKERSIGGKDHYDYVTFSNGCFCLANAVMFYEFTYGVDNYEVVGNIYDNPELLEEI